MRVLVLGGTGFLGRHLTEALLARGHEPTLVHRGRSAPALFPALEHLLLDRQLGLALPAGRRWEAAIDTCGYLPRVVAANARELRLRVEWLCFVSSVSAYADLARPGLTEEAALLELSDATLARDTPLSYGGRKAACERALAAAFPAALTIVRPGQIVGPHDSSQRFPYWVSRLARGGEVLVPAPPQAACQVIDARDLAAWMVGLVERRAQGAFHASGPARPLTFGELIEACRDPAVEAELVWVDGEFLVAQGVAPWSGLPLWAHGAGLRGIFALDLSRALASGLCLRPLAETVRDVRALEAERAARDWLVAPSPARERALIAAWRARQRARG